MSSSERQAPQTSYYDLGNAGRLKDLPDAIPDQSRIVAWLKELATKTGKGIHDSKLVGQVGHKLKVGSGTNLELYDYEEEKGARYDPLQRYPKRPAPNQIVRRDRHLRHSHIGPAVFIEERGAGFYIHGTLCKAVLLRCLTTCFRYFKVQVSDYFHCRVHFRLLPFLNLRNLRNLWMYFGKLLHE
jgi:hypothetical protein